MTLQRRALIFDDIVFDSIASLARYVEVDYSLLKSRLRAGWSLNRATKTPKPHKIVNIEGEVFPSLAAVCVAYGIRKELVKSRLYNGWTMEESLGLSERKFKRKNTEIGSVYIIRNTESKKVYVGITTKTIYSRFQQHLSESRNKARTKISQAIRNIGSKHFWIEQVDSYPIHKLREAEINLIKQHNSIENGYNERLFSCPEYQSGKVVAYKNEIYPSIASLSRAFGLTESATKHRLKQGILLEEKRGAIRRVRVIVAGEMFHNLTELARKYNVRPSLVSQRYRRGSRDMDLIQPSQKRDQLCP